jgi:hypothetical protein
MPTSGSPTALVELPPVAGELHVHQPADSEAERQARADLAHLVELGLGRGMRRQHRGGIAGVDPGLLDVLQDAADHRAPPVGHQVEIELGGLFEEAVEQHRMLPRDLRGLRHEARHRLLVVADRHGTAAQNVARSHQHREAQPARHRHRLRDRARRAVVGLADPLLGEQRAEALAVLGEVDRLG